VRVNGWASSAWEAVPGQAAASELLLSGVSPGQRSPEMDVGRLYSLMKLSRWECPNDGVAVELGEDISDLAATTQVNRRLMRSMDKGERDFYRAR